MEVISYNTFKNRCYVSDKISILSFCGEDYGYGMFKNKKPKEIAIELINQVFKPEEQKDKLFVYKATYYRGINNLQDRINVYYCSLV